MKRDQTTPSTQSTRFIEIVHAAGCSEDESVFDASLRKIIRLKLPSPLNGKSARNSRGRNEC